MNPLARAITQIVTKNPPTMFFILTLFSFLVGADEWAADLLWVSLLLQVAWILVKIFMYLMKKALTISE